ncbi:MAG: hypothetical protein ABIH70_09730 [Chloroflexota bacterium]
MKCSRCGRELTEDQSFVYQGKVMCENCVMDVGLTLKQCDPWATFVETSSRKRRGLVGSAGLNETEAKIYDFVKSKGKTTREEVMANLGLTAVDLNAQLVPLMHSELVKELGEKGKLYLVPID